MKIKANKKFNNVSPQSIPCDKADRKALKKGGVVDIDDSVASKLLAMNIVQKVTNKKSKSKENK